MKIHPPFSWFELSAELMRRKVYHVVGAYAVIGWMVLQIGEVTFEPLNLPGWTMPLLIIVVIVGFPIVFTLAWFFDLTSAGIRRDRKSLLRSGAANEYASIAVLPFVDLSSDNDQAYFCEGVAEAIINTLARIPDLSVAARSSSFEYAAKAGDVRKIGNALGVQSVLEGSVRKSNSHIRVTAQLVKVSDGFHLWSKTFDEKLEDIFAIQDEIAMSIAATLFENIAPGRLMRTTWCRDITAYDYYLRGRNFLRRFCKTNIESARQMFRQAIKIDDKCPLAWAGYADCNSLLFMYEDPKLDYRENALNASARALKLAPDLAETHVSAGLASLVFTDYESAETQFKKALELNPKLYEAYYYYGRTQFHNGNLAMAAELFRQAADLDPTDYKSRCLRVQILRGLGRTEEAAREAKEAVAIAERSLAWNPDDVSAHYFGAGPLIVLGEIDRAKRWLHRALEIDPNDSVLLYNVACNLAVMGNTNAAIRYLGQAIDHGVVNASWMQNDNALASVREDPRFSKLLSRLDGKNAGIGESGR
jgi:TolB-like protein/Flp pilus assembly protein TadD